MLMSIVVMCHRAEAGRWNNWNMSLSHMINYVAVPNCPSTSDEVAATVHNNII